MNFDQQPTRRNFLKGIAAGVILVGGQAVLPNAAEAQAKGAAGGAKGAAAAGGAKGAAAAAAGGAKGAAAAAAGA